MAPLVEASDLIRSRAWFLLGSGAVRIRHVDRTGRVDALVQGRERRHEVTRDVYGRWSCTCVAAWYERFCAHVAAVQLVTGEGDRH